MVKKCITISLAFFLGVVLLSAGGLAAAVTKLNDIRAGQHKKYTRFVLDAEGARPLKIGPTTAEGVIIVYEQLELMRKPSVLFRNMIGAAAKVSHHRQTDHSVIAITFKNPNTAVRSFYMGGQSADKGAYRLIVDLYPPGSAAAGPGALVPVASAKAAMPAPTPTPTPAAISSQQLEKILPKVLETRSDQETMRVEIASGEPKQGIDSAEPPLKARTEGKKENLLYTPPPEKASRVGATEQPSIRNELRGEKEQSVAVFKGNIPTAAKPVHILTIQPPQSGIKGNMPGNIAKASSALPIQGDQFPHLKDLPSKEKEPGSAGQRNPLGVKERNVSIPPAVEENAIQNIAVSHGRKEPIYRQASIGLVKLTLKLLSIALACLIILFLHRANKIATNRYDALMQFQHNLDTRQPR